MQKKGRTRNIKMLTPSGLGNWLHVMGGRVSGKKSKQPEFLTKMVLWKGELWHAETQMNQGREIKELYLRYVWSVHVEKMPDCWIIISNYSNISIY